MGFKHLGLLQFCFGSFLIDDPSGITSSSGPRNVAGVVEWMVLVVEWCFNAHLHGLTEPSAASCGQMDTGELVCLPRLSRVAVCGGTHGNELSGVYLVREMSRKVRRAEEGEEEEKEKKVLLVLGNPLATQQGRRYITTDLNRCFTHANLR